AGAVDATPITTFERKPIAFFFRPLSSTCDVAGRPDVLVAAGAAALSVAMWSPVLGSRRQGCLVVTKVTTSPGGTSSGAIPILSISVYTSRTMALRHVEHEPS